MLPDDIPRNDPHAEERASIDQEIVELFNKIRILSSRRNRLAPISRLPSELITRTFLSFKEEIFATLDRDQYYEWTTTLHVCAEWRDIILGSPVLWMRIVHPGFGLWRWSVESFSHSGAAPLWVDFSGLDLDEPSMDFVLSVLSQTHRIQRAHIGIDYGALKSPSWGPLKEFLEKPAPRTEAMSLHAKWPGLYPQFTLFGGNAPMLHELALSHFPVDWIHSPFEQLTHLHLSTFRDYDKSQIPFLEFIDILSRTPQLQDLQIPDQSVAFDPLATPNDFQRVVSLPHLKTLGFYLRWEVCVAFFRAVALPAPQSI